MSNQKTTQLNRLLANGVAQGDLIPIIDVSAIESGPTGETKAITAQNLGTWVANNSIAVSDKYQASQTSNGLWFNEGVVPNGDQNKYCYTPYPALGSNFSLYVRGFIPSNFTQVVGNDRVIFGVGPTFNSIADDITGNFAYIGINNHNLVGCVNDGIVSANVVVPNFFDVINPDKVFGVCLIKNSSGMLKLVVNGVAQPAASGAPASINNSYLVMGCGRSDTSPNIDCVIYEAHVFSSALTDTGSMQLFYGGANSSQPSILSSYTPENLNPGPSQWLDLVSSYHLLLPTVGAAATNPAKKFNLNFRTNTSGYLGDSTERDVLPEKYILTSCVVESDYKPLLCVGTSSSLAPISASGTGSWQDNRVPYTSASYGVNPLGIISLGVAHPDRSIYVGFASSSDAPCTFSFEGYVRN